MKGIDSTMTTKKSTKKQPAQSTPEPDYALAADRVAAILADPTTPIFLLDVLQDMINDLANETEVNDLDPDIARLVLAKAFPIAEAKGLRQMNGAMRREKGGAGR
jgi:hypothetical protein